MTNPKKTRRYVRGMELFHNESKKKITFGKWNPDGTAGCITDKTTFLNLSKTELDTEYTAYSEIEKEAKARRRGQAW